MPDFLSNTMFSRKQFLLCIGRLVFPLFCVAFFATFVFALLEIVKPGIAIAYVPFELLIWVTIGLGIATALISPDTENNF